MSAARSNARVVVVGATGEFGSRVVHLLVRSARATGMTVVATSRDLERARRLCARHEDGSVVATTLDHGAHDAHERLAALEPRIIVDAAGPFGARDYALARSAIALNAHYIDLADARERVAGIAALDADARQAGVLVTSGASTVPAITTAALDALLEGGAQPVGVDVGISPGYRGPKGLATIRSILAHCGRPVPQRLHEGGMARGWGGLRLHRYPAPMGVRLLSYVDVPELALWPLRYPTLQTLIVRAGIGVPVVHLALTGLARLRSLGLVTDLAAHARILCRAAQLFDPFGTDIGGMHVRARIRDPRGIERSRLWTLLVPGGRGPFIPASPAALLVQRLLDAPGTRPLLRRGATAASGLLTLEDMAPLWQRLGARLERTSQPDRNVSRALLKAARKEEI